MTLSTRGTSAYYAYRWLLPAQQAPVAAVDGLCRTLHAIRDLSHIEAAAPKLDWWQTEIAHLYQGHPHHPCTQALAPYLSTHAWPAAWWDALIEGIRADLLPGGLQTPADRARYIDRTGGVVAMLYATALGSTHTDTLRYAHDLGKILREIQLFRNIGRDARNHRHYLLPQDFSTTAPLPREAITYLEQRAQVLIAHYRAIEPTLLASDWTTLRSFRIFAALYLALLEEIQRDVSIVWTQSLTLTPIRKLWIAWRTAQAKQER